MSIECNRWLKDENRKCPGIMVEHSAHREGDKVILDEEICTWCGRIEKVSKQ